MTDKPTVYPPAVQGLVEKWRKRLIPEWKVCLVPYCLDLIEDPDADVDDTVGPHGSEGQSKVTHDYLVIRIWLNLEHRLVNEDRNLEQTIVHELLHAALHDLQVIYNPVKYDAISPVMGRLLDQESTTALERTIERLSRALVEAEHGDTSMTVTPPA